MFDKSGWQVVGRPPQIGRRKKEYYAELDKQYGPGNWDFVWLSGTGSNGELVTWKSYLEMCALYEESYRDHFRNHPWLFEELLREAKGVYDNALSNVESGTNYKHQEADATHIQDIAIRNIVKHMGRVFYGDELIQIKGSSKHPLGRCLSPGFVPFKFPESIILVDGHLPNFIGKIPWYLAYSVESYYQGNRILIVRC